MFVRDWTAASISEWSFKDTLSDIWDLTVLLKRFQFIFPGVIDSM